MKFTTDGNNTKFDVYDISNALSASGIAFTGRCGFAGLVVGTDGTNDVVLNVYDGLTASGKRLIPIDMSVLGSRLVWTLNYNPPIRVDYGVYVAITCAGTCSVQVIYDI